jgi:ATP-binding cassette subfamily E protein 1
MHYTNSYMIDMHIYYSYKPQKITPKFMGTVRELLHKKIRDAYIHPQFVSDVMKPMSMEAIIDNSVQNLSGGELQRVAIVLSLGTPADIYLVCLCLLSLIEY